MSILFRKLINKMTQIYKSTKLIINSVSLSINKSSTKKIWNTLHYIIYSKSSILFILYYCPFRNAPCGYWSIKTTFCHYPCISAPLYFSWIASIFPYSFSKMSKKTSAALGSNCVPLFFLISSLITSSSKLFL